MTHDYFTIAFSALSIVAFIGLSGLLLFNNAQSSELVVTLNVYSLKKYSALLRPNKVLVEFVAQTKGSIQRRTQEMVGRNRVTGYDIVMFAVLNMVLLVRLWDRDIVLVQAYQLLYPVLAVLGVTLWHCANLKLQKNVLLSYSLIDYQHTPTTQPSTG